MQGVIASRIDRLPKEDKALLQLAAKYYTYQLTWKAVQQDKTEGGWHRVERAYGNFERAFTLPETVNPEGTKADYKNGVLTITLPKKELAKPRQVKVQVSNN